MENGLGFSLIQSGLQAVEDDVSECLIASERIVPIIGLLESAVNNYSINISGLKEWQNVVFAV